MSSSSFPPPELREIATEVASLLKARKETISVAETAAGGLISAALLALPGASTYYAGGLTLYTLASRAAFVGWSAADTASYRGPTPAVVALLARNTRAKLGSVWTVAESGTAGPTGGEARERTPGYVALGVAWEGGVRTRVVETGGREREANMVRFAVEALRLVRDVVRGEGEAGDEVEEGEAEADGLVQSGRLVPGDRGADDEVAIGALAS